MESATSIPSTSAYTPPAPAIVPVAPEPTVPPPESWGLGTIVAFRFCLLYFGAYVLTTQMAHGIPLVGNFVASVLRSPGQALDVWAGTHLLGAEQVVFQPTGSGDTLHDWAHALALVMIATIGAAVWSVLRRNGHPRAYAWFRLFLRFALGTTMLGYGMAKVIPTQMPVVSLERLVEPFGDFSPMGVLWYSIGASPAYEIATGCAETLAGVLLLIPALASVGAIVCVFVSTQVFLLNMTYDVPVKLFSFHLVLMSLVLLAPNARRLFDALVRHIPAAAAPEPALASSAMGRRVWDVAQLVFALWTVGTGLLNGERSWNMYGGGAPRSALFGIWTVEEMTIDGRDRPPLLSDTLRWRHVIFQQPASVSFQRMDNAFVRYSAQIDAIKQTLTLTTYAPRPGAPAAPKVARSVLTYKSQWPDVLDVTGTMDGHAVAMRLRKRPLESFPLKSRGFHWVQEFPFNR